MKTILLKLAGPLQSWGTDSNFETRSTDRRPSKSAIIGLLSACCGFRRDDDEKIRELNSLDFAVRVDQPGKLLRDYHIATKKKKNGNVDRTYVTNRYYLQDAVFVIALGSEDEFLIQSLGNALMYPYFQPFLGRRSLPLNADFFLGIEEMGVIESLNALPWQASNWHRIKYQKDGRVRLMIYADADLIESPRREIKRDLVNSFSSKKRKHGFRLISKGEVKLSLEHDAFGALGG